MIKVVNDHWEIERDEDGDYFLRQRSVGHYYFYVENKEMRSLLEGVYDILKQMPEEHGEIDGVTR